MLELIAVAAILSLGAIKCMQIKYTSTREVDKLAKRLTKIETSTAEIDGDLVIALKRDVQSLKNQMGLAPRR